MPHITDIANVSSSELNDGLKSQCDSPATRPAANYCSPLITSRHAATQSASHHCARCTMITSTTSTGCYCCCTLCNNSAKYINPHQFFHKWNGSKYGLVTFLQKHILLPDDGPVRSETCWSLTFLNMVLWTVCIYTAVDTTTKVEHVPASLQQYKGHAACTGQVTTNENLNTAVTFGTHTSAISQLRPNLT